MKRALLAVFLGWLLVVFQLSVAGGTSQNRSSQPEPPRNPSEVERYQLFLYEEALRNNLRYADFLLLKSIIQAESGWKKIKKGEVLRGKENKKDVGLAQINELYHLKTAQSLGYDIYTAEGNLKMAVYIYKKQGTKPWKWSQKKWMKKQPAAKR